MYVLKTCKSSSICFGKQYALTAIKKNTKLINIFFIVFSLLSKISKHLALENYTLIFFDIQSSQIEVFLFNKSKYSARSFITLHS